MPKSGYYSLTIREETASKLRDLAEKQNLGLVEYFENLAASIEQIRIGKLLELSAVKTCFCQELYRPIEEVQLITEKLLERQAKIDQKKKRTSDGFNMHILETLLRYSRKAHIINLYTLDAIHALDPTIDIPEIVKESRKSIEQEMKALSSDTLLDQSMLKIVDRLREFFSGYEKLLTKFGKDEEPIKTFILIVDGSIADLRKDVQGIPKRNTS
jgi:hypothetical protein